MDGRSIFSLMAMTATSEFTFLLCYFSDKTTRLMLDVGDGIYNSDWMHCPSNLRRFHLLIMIRSKNEIHFNGLKLVNCNQVTFTQVRFCYYQNLKPTDN